MNVKPHAPSPIAWPARLQKLPPELTTNDAPPLHPLSRRRGIRKERKSDAGLGAARGRPYRGSHPSSSSFRITFPALSSTVSRSVDTTTSGLRGSSTVHVDLDEPPHHLPDLLADVAIRRDRGGDVGHAMLGEKLAHPADPADVGVAILAGKPQPLAEMGTNDVGPTDEQDRQISPLLNGKVDSAEKP